MVLTPREAEVLAAVARNRTNAEIAAELYISVRTVETHVSSLLRKLDADSRRELARRAHAVLRPADPSARPPELIGRAAELTRLQELLAGGGLVTVLGPGGIGKTTLVRALSHAILVDLTSLPAGSGAPAVWAAALDAVGLDLPEGRRPDAALAAALAGRQVVLVLDNCEHLLDAAAAVVGRLAATSGVGVVATTRERIGVPGERILRLEPLAPDPALELFVRRAADLEPPVALTPEQCEIARAVCRSVECVPLAVELAAARLGQLGLEDLDEAVAAGIDVLDGGRGRQRSVRSVLDWSYDLLSAVDQRTHRRLSVLSGPFLLPTASAVAGEGSSVAGSIARLVDASLLVRGADDRYRQLDLVRAHAGERLMLAGEEDRAVTALLDWASASVHADAQDETSLRAAAVAAEGVRDGRGVELLRLLAHHWSERGLWQDAVDSWERAARAGADPADALAAAELAMAHWQGDEAWRLFGLVAQTSAGAGDPQSLVRALEAQIELGSRFPAVLHRAPELGVLEGLLEEVRALDTGGDIASEGLLACAEAWVLSTSGDHVGAESAARRAVAVARTVDQPVLESAAWDAVGGVAANHGDAAGLYDASEQRLALRDRLEGSPRAEMERSDLAAMAVDAALAVGRFREARARAEQLLDRERARGLAHVGLGRLVSFEFHLGEFDDALAHAAEAVADWEEYGGGPAAYLVAPAAACVAISGYRGRAGDESAWSDLADRVSRRPGGASGSPLMRALRADVHLFHGRVDLAAEQVAESAREVWGVHRALYAAVRASVLGGDAVREAELLVRGDRLAAAVLVRAKGDLDAALHLFSQCDAGFEVARTQVAARPEDSEACAALDRHLASSASGDLGR